MLMMRRPIYPLTVLSALILLVTSSSTHVAGGSYRAATVQFTPSGIWSDPPAQVIQESIDRFGPFVTEAKAGGAQLIVFPEGALGMFNAEITNTRDAMLPWCVQIGDVANQPNPCNQFKSNPPPPSSTNYQLYTASCLAQKNKIILAMNLCETRPCSNSTDPNCPSDNRYQWNTEIAFNESGTIVMKYHKAHLFGGAGVFDEAKPVAQSFVSSFGVTFGTFICFDILYQHPAVDLVQAGVTDFLFSSYWVNPTPSMNAVMQQQGWSRLHGVNLIASNIGAYSASSGGGIYSAGEVLASLFDPSNPTINQLLMADVPILSNSKYVSNQRIETDDEESSYEHLKEQLLTRSSTPNTISLDTVYQPCQPNPMFNGIANCTLFSGTDLLDAAEASGVSESDLKTYTIQLSFNAVACFIELTFVQLNTSEQFVAFAYEGIQTFPYTPDALSLQVCAVHHCIPGTNTSQPLACQPTWAEYQTTIDLFSITATGFESDASAFPMLGVSNGQVLADTSATEFNDQNPPHDQRVIQWSSATNFQNQSLFSVVVYGIRPDQA